MALLSQMMRTVAITGRTDSVNAWFADRQGKQWTERTIRSAFPAAAPEAQRAPASPAATTQPPIDPAKTLQELTGLYERGIIDEAELEKLRARLHVERSHP